MATHPTTPAAASAGDLAWFEGRWTGTHGSNPVEEHWAGPEAGALMGMFRMIKEGTTRFFELITIEEESGGVAMRVKHFDPGLTGWEEKDECIILDLVVLEGYRSIWSKRGDPAGKWLVYERSGDDMSAWFEKPDAETPEASRFQYRLRKN